MDQDGTRERWAQLRAEAARCTRCPLYRHASGTVFGEGPVNARLMIVGEQPGDREDLAGRPFVGPAGQVLDRAMAEAGLERNTAYVTNAVRHFKFVQRGKRRLHSKPDPGEVEACRWWLEHELAIIRPALTLAMGATAVRALFGKVLTITRLRGAVQQLPGGEAALVTVHPSYLLRIRDRDQARSEYRHFVADLAQAAILAQQG